MGEEEKLIREVGVLGALSWFRDLVEGWSLCAVTAMPTQHTHPHTHTSLTHAASTVTHVGLAALHEAADLHTEGQAVLGSSGDGERAHLSWAGCGPG